MKKFLILLAALAAAAGFVFVACHRSNSAEPEVPSTFPSFQAEILDLDYWTAIRTPGVMGLDEAVTLVVGKSGYEDPKYYPGDVTWSVAPVGVLVFEQVTLKTSVSQDQRSATGNIVGIRSIGEGSATVIASDAEGNILTHEFVVGNGQHYRPDGQWQDNSSSSGYTNSSSCAYPTSSSYSSMYPQSSSSGGYQYSSSTYPQSSSSAYQQSSSSTYQQSSSSSY